MFRFLVGVVLGVSVLVGSARGEVTAADTTAIQGFRKGMSLEDIAKMGYPYPKRDDDDDQNEYIIEDFKGRGLLPTGIYKIILFITPEEGLLKVTFILGGEDGVHLSDDDAIDLFKDAREVLEAKYSKGYSETDKIFNEQYFVFPTWQTSMIKDQYRELQIDKILLKIGGQPSKYVVGIAFAFVGHDASPPKSILNGF